MMKHPLHSFVLLAAFLLPAACIGAGIRYVPVWGVTGAQLGPSALFAATDLALDSQGNLIVVGTGGSGPSPSGIVAKISPAGSVIWYQSITQPGSLGTSANAVACDASDNVYVTGGLATGSRGEVIVAKFTSAGTAVWTLTTSGGAPGGLAELGGAAIAVDATGVYVGGMWGFPTPQDWLAKLPLGGGWAGAIVMATAGVNNSSVTSIALDGSSTIYASFRFQGLSQPAVAAYSSAGTFGWSRTNTTWNYTDCGGGMGANGWIVRVRVAPDGAIWALGSAGTMFMINASTGSLAGGSVVGINHLSAAQPPNDFAFWPAGVAVFSAPGEVFARSSSCLSQDTAWVTDDFSGTTPGANATFYPASVAAGANGDVYAVGSGSVALVALRDVLTPPNTVKAGTLEIRNNIISLGGGGIEHARTAHIFVRAATGNTQNTVKVSVFGPSGRFMGSLAGITIGADGTGSLAFDGVVEGKRLSTGMYYIVVNGAGVKGRKPIMIMGKKDL